MKMKDKQKNKSLIKDSWIYLWATFKTGDAVMVVLDDDNYWWGKFVASYKCCIVDGHEFDWNKVVLICHDGFPVKFVKTNIGAAWFDKNRGSLSGSIREAVLEIKKDRKDEIEWEREQKERKERRANGYVSFGEPFLLENISVRGFNINSGANEEFLSILHTNGTRGILYDLDGVLEFSKN